MLFSYFQIEMQVWFTMISCSQEIANIHRPTLLCTELSFFDNVAPYRNHKVVDISGTVNLLPPLAEPYALELHKPL